MKTCSPDNVSACAAKASYTVQSAPAAPEGQGLWDGAVWGSVPALDINLFHAASKSQHPKAQAKLLYDATHIYVHFRVDDLHVQSQYMNFQDNVCRDSCVEFFFKPRADQGYFNFEINCGGTLLLYYIANAERLEEGGFASYRHMTWEKAKQISIYHTMPRMTPAPIRTPTTWQIETAIPWSILSHYVGDIDKTPGSQWEANLYKCGGDQNYAHYASWSPQGPNLNFHQPNYFGNLIVGK